MYNQYYCTLSDNSHKGTQSGPKWPESALKQGKPGISYVARMGSGQDGGQEGHNTV